MALAGWVGQPVVNSLVEIVSSHVRVRINRKGNVKTALNKLHDALLPIQAVLEHAKKRELNIDQNPRLRQWLWELRDAIEEAEDVLDEMEYDRLKCQILERDAEEKELTSVADRSSGYILKLINFFKVHCCTSFIKHSCIELVNWDVKVDVTIEKLNTAVENIHKVSAKIDILNNLILSSPLSWGVDNINTPSLRRLSGPELTSDVFGREEDKYKVLKWLFQSDGDEQDSQISALTIWGVVGVGKTTLAQYVYNDAKLYFDVKMWVSVSNNNDDMTILVKRAIESATRMPPRTTEFLHGLQQELIAIVQAKRFLLVLDDVWDGQSNQTEQQWHNFISVISHHAKRGSKIIITSQIESVAETVLHGLRATKELFPLRCLQEEESLSLFYKYALFGVNPNKRANLMLVGEKIAKKCGGLPLALKIIGGLLNTQLDITYWISISEKNIIGGYSNVKEAMKLSYQSLSPNLQLCFRTCSLFPGDYEYKKKELVTFWIGLDCVDQSIGKIDQEDIAKSYLDLLVKRSFFVYNSKRESFTMHNLLHDLARDVSEGECLRVEGDRSIVLPKTLRHLFVDQLNSELLKEMSGLKKLRTLALTYSYNRYFNSADLPDYGEVNDLLKQLTSLRALFICSRTMPNLSAIEHIKHLRLFHLQVGILNKPLKPLFKLYQLQNLKCEEPTEPTEFRVARNQIEFDGIGNLINLRYLVLPGIVFDRITQLRHLIRLKELDLHLKEGNVFKLSDLKNLYKLRHLSITDERETISFDEIEAANLDKMDDLEMLSLNWTNCQPQCQEHIYNCLQLGKYSKLKNLKVFNYSCVRTPIWMTSHYLPHLTRMELTACNKLENFPPLGQLPSLAFLSLEGMAGVKQSGLEFFGSENDGGFPSLEELRIEKMENWEEWTRAENTSWFPCLRKIWIENCRQLKSLPALPLSLKELHLESVGLIVLPTQQDVFEHEVSLSLEYIRIFNCNNLLASCPSSSATQSFGQTRSTFSKVVEIDNTLLLQIKPLRSLESVEELRVYCDKHARYLPHQWLLQNHSSLRTLTIELCPLFESLPDDMPSFLTSLIIMGCTLLKSLPSEMPSSLTTLQIWDCPNLEALPHKIPSSLMRLEIRNCPLLKELCQITEIFEPRYTIPEKKASVEVPVTTSKKKELAIGLERL